MQQKTLLDAIHVCSLSSVPSVIAASRARHLVTCLAEHGSRETPAEILAGRHLRLVMHDIDAPIPGYLEPNENHVEDLVDFAATWDRQAPMLIHCFAGISRSTAAAFIALCVLNPGVPEAAIAGRIRSVSPSAMPNRRLIALGDAVLGRRGRMIQAAVDMGIGQVELAAPFSLPGDLS